ncbi:MAG: hypothetical protein QOG94_3047 [Solirubrobacteraceae bacterium]|nr:hypothetical protein [Solirubrobacteraceae bacterium]
MAEVAKASGYSKRNVQEALTSLAAAGAATLASNGSEQRFAVDRSRWGASAGSRASRTPDLPRLADLLGSAAPDSALAQAAEPEALSDYLRASQAGDLLDVVRPELSRAGVLMPARLGGERTWTDLEKTIEYALSWLAPVAGTNGRPGVFEIVPDVSEGHWWRLTAAGGRIVATSAETYASRPAARAAVERVRRAHISRSGWCPMPGSTDGTSWLTTGGSSLPRPSHSPPGATPSALHGTRVISSPGPRRPRTCRRSPSTARVVTSRCAPTALAGAGRGHHARGVHPRDPGRCRAFGEAPGTQDRGPWRVVVHGRDGHVRSTDVVGHG